MIDPKWDVTKEQMAEYLSSRLIVEAHKPDQDTSVGMIIVTLQTILDQMPDGSRLSDMRDILAKCHDS